MTDTIINEPVVEVDTTDACVPRCCQHFKDPIFGADYTRTKRTRPEIQHKDINFFFGSWFRCVIMSNSKSTGLVQ